MRTDVVRGVREQRAADLEHRVGARQREPRRDGVAQPAAAVPALEQGPALRVRGVRRGVQLGEEVAVGQHEPARDSQAGPLGLGEQLLLRAREVRAEDERGRRAVAGQAADERPRHVARVGGVASRASSGSVRVASQSSSVMPHRADDRDLRVVDVQVDETGDEHRAGRVDDRRVRMGGADGRERAGREDPPGVVVGEPAVGERLERAGALGERVARRVEDLGADDRRSCQARSKTMSCAPSHSVISPSARRFSLPSTTVRKWFPASWPTMLANRQPP